MKNLKKTLIIIFLCLPLLAYATEGKDADCRSGNRIVEIALFPINIVPNIASNTVIYLFNPIFSPITGKGVSNLWPIISVVSPVLGPVMGTMDAWYGYPFWNPVALDEHRKY